MEIADILMRKSKDPRLSAVTVTEVELTDDLRLARVYVTTLSQGEAEAHLMSGLQRAAGFIRSELGRRLSLRYNPALEFHRDVSGPRGDRILALLDEVQAGSDEAADRGVPEEQAPPEDDGRP